MKKLFIKLILLLILPSLCGCSSNLHNEDDIIFKTESGYSINLGMENVDTLNPLFTNSFSVKDCMQLIFEPLFSFDEALNPVCVLAESCMPSKDFLTYTINLKTGIKWHDGSDFTSADVKQSMNLIRYNQSPYSQNLKNIYSITTPDEKTVVIKLSKPDANITAVLSFPIVQKSIDAQLLPDYVPIGTGPYKYDKKISSNKIRLVPNKNWSGNIPSMNEIHLNIYKDIPSLISAFNASEIDAVSSVCMDLRTNTPRGEIKISDYISNNLVFLGINNSYSEFKSANTRKALSLLIDKDDIVTTEVFSRAVCVNVPVNPSAWYAPKSSTPTKDKTYIEELLSLDGWTLNENNQYTRNVEITDDSGEVQKIDEILSVNILINDNNNERVKVAEKIATEFNKFNIQTKVIKVGFEDYQNRISEKKYSLFIGEIQIPYNMDLSSLLSTNNYFSYYSKNMNDALYNISISTQTQSIKDAYSNLSVLFTDEMPFIPLYFRKEGVIFEKSVSGTNPPTMFTTFKNPENWYVSKIKTTEQKEDIKE